VQILTYFVALAAVARVSMFIPDDRLFLPVKRWLIRVRGEDSNLAYLATCGWCISIWLGVLIMVPTVFILWGWEQWLLALVSAPASSLVAGLLSKLRG
jgi:hypothetical protein